MMRKPRLRGRGGLAGYLLGYGERLARVQGCGTSSPCCLLWPVAGFFRRAILGWTGGGGT